MYNGPVCFNFSPGTNEVSLIELYYCLFIVGLFSVLFAGFFFSHLTSEMEKCRTELVSKESELEHLKRSVSIRTSQISGLEESLQSMRGQLISKSDTGQTFTVSSAFSKRLLIQDLLQSEILN